MKKLVQNKLVYLGTGSAMFVVSLAGFFVNREIFFRSYLSSYLFWFGIVMGAYLLSNIHRLSGGLWGETLKPYLENATRTIPLMALLFIPVLLGLSHIYEWADPHEAHLLGKKELFLNPAFFSLRAVIYFSVWIGFSSVLNSWSKKKRQTGTAAHDGGLKLGAGLALVTYGLTMSFAAFDWIMSLEPHWYSTIYGLLVISGQALLGLTAMTLSLYFLGLDGVHDRARVFHDLGNLLLAFVMIWAYLSFSQFLIIWSANMPEEIHWYLHRFHGIWKPTVICLVLFHFVVPFVLLLMRALKRNPNTLVVIAGLVLIARILEIHWLVKPSFLQEGFPWHWMDATTFIAIGGLWKYLYIRNLETERRGS